MHIFITGVAGFLGSNLADYYLKKGFKVSGNDNLVGGEIQNVDPKVNFYQYDSENLELNSKYFKDVDTVIHCAAYAHEGLSIFSPYLISKNIFSGSVSVFTAAVKQKVKRIVFCSSMARYGHIKQPYKESDTPIPVDPYGIAKLAAEKVLINMSETHGIEYNIAVPHNIIGAKQKYDDPFRNVASIMINLILQNRQPIIYGDGSQKRCFSDIVDCIYCLDKLISDKNIVSETVNIGPDEELITINEIFEKISNQIKYNKGAIYHPERPNEVKYASCSSEKARKLLNYKTTVNLDQSIEKVINFIKKNGVKKFEYNYNLEIKNDKTPVTWKNKLF